MGHTLVIVGVGHVGSYVLADAAASGLFQEITVIDTREGVARGEALDQHHATAMLTRTNTTIRAGGYDACADADIVVIAAGPSMIPDPDNPTAVPDRALLTEHNAEVIRQVMGDIASVTTDPVVIVISNPVDTLAYLAATEFGFPPGRVFGTGTMLDSARMRRLVADRHHVDPSSVTAMMFGEHGLSAVPALSLLSINGVPPAEFGDGTPYELRELADAVVAAAYDVFNAKGWTNAGIAQAAVLLCRAVLLDERSVHPVSLPLSGQYGLSDVALSIPCVIGAGGVVRQLEPSISRGEQEMLEASAAAIQDAMRRAGARFTS